MFKRSELRSALLVVLFISFAFVSKAQLWITGDDSYNIIEDYDGAVFDVKSNDINLTLESDIYIFISIPPVHGLATIDEANDWIIYTPNANFAGNDIFEYTICADTDPDECGTAFVNIEIDSVDDAPIAVNDFVNTYINTPFNIELLLNDIDVDEQGLEFEILDDAFPGTTTILPFFPEIGEYIYYEPAFNFVGEDSLIYRVCKLGSEIYCDTATVYINVLTTNFNKPVAVNDTFNILIDIPSEFNVLANDFDGDGDGLSITELITPGITGVAEISASNTINYISSVETVDDFAYVVCDDNIPALCDTAFVHVVVSETVIIDDLVFVPNSFSPNGDGINDVLDIIGIENYPKYNIKIYDRWSSLVFETSNDVKMWNGKSNTEFISTSGDVPEGTYFYVLRLEEAVDPFTGFIVIKR